MKKLWINSEMVTNLREKLVGKICGNICEGKGVQFIDGVYHDCACTKEFLRELQMIGSGIPSRYFDFDFEHIYQKFEAENTQAIEVIHKYVDNIREMVDGGVGLFIFGEKGLAKTAFGCLILKEAIKVGKVAYMLSMSELSSMFRDSISDEATQEKLEWIQNTVEILLIDEIEKDFNVSDTTNYTGSYTNKFFRIIYDRKVALIATSNVKMSSLKGRQADNVIDRLQELILVPFVGKSYRSNEGAERLLLDVIEKKSKRTGGKHDSKI